MLQQGISKFRFVIAMTNGDSGNFCGVAHIGTY